MSLDLLDQIDQYRKLFTDAVFWQPYVRSACYDAGLSCGVVRGGIAGTCPVFIVDNRYVVKFFGRLFDGEKGFQAELHANRIAQSVREIPLPSLITQGQLLPGGPSWSWPYLIYGFLPGVPIGQVWDQLTEPMKLDIAAQLGQTIKLLHAIPLTSNPYFSNDWTPFLAFLEMQRKTCSTRLRAAGGIPDHLLKQVEPFFLPIDQLVDPNRFPHLIHADLTRDHLLGCITDGKWLTSGLIDFGDAKVGNIFYELVALHLDLFQASKAMLKTFLQVYQPDRHVLEGFSIKAMNMLLLHEFGVEIFHNLFIHSPELTQIDTLDALADTIWGIDLHKITEKTT